MQITGHGGLIVNGFVNGAAKGRWKERGLVLATAAPLLGVVPMAAQAHARGGPDEGAAGDAGRGVELRTAGPRTDVRQGRAYSWTFAVTAKGPAKSGKAVFRATLPKSLEFVSGKKNCTAKGQKVVCRLGTLKKGKEVRGVLRAKVSYRAGVGHKITLRGTVTWGKARVTRRFPAVRVSGSAAYAVADEPARSRVRAEAP